MRFPSKVTSYRESIFPAMLSLCKVMHASEGHLGVRALLDKVRNQNISTEDAVMALDVLYALRKVSLMRENAEVIYVV